MPLSHRPLGKTPAKPSGQAFRSAQRRRQPAEDQMNDTALPITGYLDRFSHRPGEAFVAHISMREPGGYRARLVRVLSGDPNPAGPGLRFEDLSKLFEESFEGQR